jgi:hypothetical protein
MISNPGAGGLDAWAHRMAARPGADRALIRSRCIITAISSIIIVGANTSLQICCASRHRGLEEEPDVGSLARSRAFDGRGQVSPATGGQEGGHIILPGAVVEVWVSSRFTVLCSRGGLHLTFRRSLCRFR